jgi:NAD(P)-dependent dehydrogenase (short-subunit alcohol dehydrogenase family)
MPMNPPIHDWRGRVVWLVGASTGIGRALAEALHARGAWVVASARPSPALDDLARALPGAWALPLDATALADCRQAAARVLDRLGRIDLVLYCAGTYQPLRATAWDLGVMLRHQQVNQTGALHLIDAVLPALRRQAQAGQPAHLSLVASVAGYRALPQALAYGPTKAALIHLAQGLHLDLAPLGLGVSLINPGFVATPLTAQNHFHMPALMSPAQAAQAILAGWARGDFEIHFPRRFTLGLKALSLLPAPWYERVVRGATGA